MLAFTKPELEHILRQFQIARAQFHADTGAPNPPIQTRATDQFARPGVARK